MKEKKYRQGPRFQTFFGFMAWHNCNQPVYWRHKFMSPRFIEHWSIIMIKNSIRAGNLRMALKNIKGENNEKP